MPEYLRTLVMILFLATVVFYLAGRSRVIYTAQNHHLNLRKKLWLLFTLAAFLLHNFWIYALVVVVGLVATRAREPNPTPVFYFLLFLLPAANIQIPSFGLANNLFDLNHIRLLSLVLLLPAWLKLRRGNSVPRFGKFGSDKLLAMYLILLSSLMFARSPTMTAALRSVLGLFVDVFLPYFVFSRAVRDMRDFKDVISSYVIAASIVGVVGVFEVTRHWLLYRPVVDVLGLNWPYGSLAREGMLRAGASAGQPIALGFAIMVAAGFYHFIVKGNTKGSRLLGTLLVGGVVAPLSRGPWVGLAAMVLAVVGTGRQATKKLMGLFFVTALLFALLIALPGGQRIIAFLPFLGSVETGSVDYRQRLIDNSLIVIERNPLFGSTNFLETPEMQEMMQGQGIIDVTNTYLAIALGYGLVGLGLFAGFFLWTMFSIYCGLKKHRSDAEAQLLGQVLFGVLVAILTTLATVSSITVIPTIYWTVAGLSVAYIQFSQGRGGSRGEVS